MICMRIQIQTKQFNQKKKKMKNTDPSQMLNKPRKVILCSTFAGINTSSSILYPVILVNQEFLLFLCVTWCFFKCQYQNLLAKVQGPKSALKQLVFTNKKKLFSFFLLKESRILTHLGSTRKWTSNNIPSTIYKNMSKNQTNTFELVLGGLLVYELLKSFVCIFFPLVLFSFPHLKTRYCIIRTWTN